MLEGILSYIFGILGIYFGFAMTEGLANALTGFHYLFFFIPVLLGGSAVGGAAGFYLGKKLAKMIQRFTMNHH